MRGGGFGYGSCLGFGVELLDDGMYEFSYISAFYGLWEECMVLSQCWIKEMEGIFQTMPYPIKIKFQFDLDLLRHA